MAGALPRTLAWWNNRRGKVCKPSGTPKLAFPGILVSSLPISRRRLAIAWSWVIFWALWSIAWLSANLAVRHRNRHLETSLFRPAAYNCRPADNRAKKLKDTADLLRNTQWGQALSEEAMAKALAGTKERLIPTGSYVCMKGDPAEHWIGVIDGLVKIASHWVTGKTVTFTGVPPGGWLGEGSMLKREPRRYDVIALRDSRIAYMNRTTFQWLLDNSIPFNRFLLNHLNERLGQFIGMVEHERLLDTDARIARCLAGLFNPVLYPGTNRQLQISQEELGYLAGVSRQRANQALKVLEEAGLLRIEYGGITVLDVEGLRSFEN